MASATPSQNSFVAGQLDPRIAGRADIQQYYQSAAEIKNLVVKPFGGVEKTPGTYFMNAVKTSSSLTIVRPFIFSDTQAYVIEMGDRYFRFYRNNGQILDGSSAYELATTYPSSALRQLQFTQTGDLLTITHPDYPVARLTRTAHDSWSINNINYAASGNRPPLRDENSDEGITIKPSATTGTITLTSSGASLFDATHVGSIWMIGLQIGTHGYAQITAVSAGGLKTVATASVLYGGSLPSTAATSNWSEGAFSGYRGYPKACAISEQRLCLGYTRSDPQQGWASYIGGYDNYEPGVEDSDAISWKTDTKQVETIEWLFPSEEIMVGTAGGVHSFGTGSDSIPLTPTSGRIKKKSTYAASSLPPYQIGGSVFYWQKYDRILREYSYSTDQFRYNAADATILSQNIASDGIVDWAYQQNPNNVMWCVTSEGDLISFTFEENQGVRAWAFHDTDGYYESVCVIPKTTYDEVWFVVRRTINGETKRYIEYMVAPDFDEQEDAFFVHSGLTIDSPLAITNIAVVSSTQLQITCPTHGLSNTNPVKIRGVEGTTEVNKRKFLVADAQTNSFIIKDLDGNYIDGSDYTAYETGGEARLCVSSIGGLDHLEGKTVQVFVDGGAHPARTVSSGVITLVDTYGQRTVGLGYTARLKTHDLEGAPGRYSSKAKRKRVIEVFIDLYRTLGCSIGTDDGTDDVKFRTSAMPTDQPTELFTGLKRKRFPSGWDREKYVVIEQTQPLPLHIRSITSEMEIN